jgi:parvulin-like peptidyl-prolyl isomerase
MISRRARHWLPTLSVALMVACSGGEGDDGSKGPGRPPPAQPEATGPVVADVGIGYVTAEEFGEVAGRSPGATNEMDLAQRKAILDDLITEEAMFQEALQVGLVRDPKVRKVLVNLLLRKEVYAKVDNADFSDEELRAYYDEHKDDFVVPAKVQVKRILVGFGEERSREEAEKILAAARKKIVRDPGLFTEIAGEISEDAYRRRGGDLGFLPRDGKPGIDPKVAEVAFDLKSGQLSDLFEADGGLNLVMAVTRRDEVERSFAQMRGSVLRKLRNERFQELTEQYVDKLRAEAGVTIHDEALQAAEVQSRPGAGLDLDIRGPDDHDGDHGHGHGPGPDRRGPPIGRGKRPGAP